MRRGVAFAVCVAALVSAGSAWASPPRVSASERAQINRTLDIFVNHAVKRHDPEAAYDVVTPTLKGGMTRGQWSHGDIGVYPYPAKGARFHEWNIQYRTKDELSVELILAPTKRYQAQARADPLQRLPAAFARALARRLVHARGDVRADRQAGRRAGGSRLHREPERADIQPEAASRRAIGAARISAKWAVVPFAVILLLLLALAGRGVVENLRFRRLAASHARPLSMSSDEPRARPRNRP